MSTGCPHDFFMKCHMMSICVPYNVYRMSIGFPYDFRPVRCLGRLRPTCLTCAGRLTCSALFRHSVVASSARGGEGNVFVWVGAMACVRSFQRELPEHADCYWWFGLRQEDIRVACCALRYRARTIDNRKRGRPWWTSRLDYHGLFNMSVCWHDNACMIEAAKDFDTIGSIRNTSALFTMHAQTAHTLQCWLWSATRSRSDMPLLCLSKARSNC